MTGERATLAAVAAHPRGSLLVLSVAPRSATNRLERQGDGTLRARITAPPVDGAANAALLRLLADLLDLPRSRLAVATGASGRQKRIVVAGMEPAELAARVRDALPQP